MATLYIVATPIGNLKDITLRALDILREVDCIAAEDTRHSARLLSHYGIQQKLISLHEFNEDKKVEKILNLLDQGQNVALISDAGTPLISDPGFPLVAQAQEKKIEVVPIPGPCALIAALSAAGLPTHHFLFEGFLPSKGEKRRKHLENLVQETRTLIFYESVHRIENLLELMVEVFGGDRLGCVARELTKMYETIRRAPLQELSTWLETVPGAVKGEFVVLVAGNQKVADIEEAEIDRILMTLMSEIPLKQAVKLAQKLTNVSRQKLYEQALKLKPPKE